MLKRKMLYVATVVVVMLTSGCFDCDAINRLKGWVGCSIGSKTIVEGKKADSVKKEKSSEKKKSEVKKKQKKDKEVVVKPIHTGGATFSPNPELSAEDFFVKTVTAEDVRHGLETSDRLVVIDTAAKEVYDDCHIIGAISIPLETLNEGIEGISRDTSIILYCATDKCPRSTKAAQLLQQRGYTDIAVYPGGMRDWFNSQHPYDGPAERAYLKNKKK